jgi:hypothetical protein
MLSAFDDHGPQQKAADEQGQKVAAGPEGDLSQHPPCQRWHQGHCQFLQKRIKPKGKAGNLGGRGCNQQKEQGQGLPIYLFPKGS